MTLLDMRGKKTDTRLNFISLYMLHCYLLKKWYCAFKLVAIQMKYYCNWTTIYSATFSATNLLIYGIQQTERENIYKVLKEAFVSLGIDAAVAGRIAVANAHRLPRLDVYHVLICGNLSWPFQKWEERKQTLSWICCFISWHIYTPTCWRNDNRVFSIRIKGQRNEEALFSITCPYLWKFIIVTLPKMRGKEIDTRLNLPLHFTVYVTLLLVEESLFCIENGSYPDQKGEEMDKQSFATCVHICGNSSWPFQKWEESKRTLSWICRFISSYICYIATCWRNFILHWKW